MKCGFCGEVVKSCEDCGHKFAVGEDVICLELHSSDHHFCSEDCGAMYYFCQTADYSENEVIQNKKKAVLD